MSAIVQSPAIAPVDGPLLGLLSKAERLADRFSGFAAVVILLLFAFWSWSASRGTRLQFDELLELSAAHAPTSHDVLSFLASGVDYNPPLSHFVIRLSTSLLGATEWAARLPAFLGMTLLLICLYATIARQVSPTYGLIAMLAIVCSPVRDYAVQARPYGLVLGFSGLLFVLYRQAVGPRRRSRTLVGLAICAAALTATHYYAILVLGIPLALEVEAIWKRRRPDWKLIICCSVPSLLVLFALRGAILNQKQQLTHYFAKGNLLSFDHGYDILAMDPLIYCVALLLIFGVMVLRPQGSQANLGCQSGVAVPRIDVAWGLGLLLLPIVGAFITQFATHAYVARYFLPAAIGFAICLCYGAKLAAPSVPSLGIILLISLSLGFGKAMLQEAHRPAEQLPSIEALTADQTPLLFDTPGTYMQVAHYFPGLRSNLWVIADPVASLHYRNYDTDDKIMLALSAHGEAQAITLSEAARRWTHFRLVPRSADYIWALECVMDADSQVTVREPFGNSNFIFDVSVRPDQLTRIDSCSQPTP